MSEPIMAWSIGTWELVAVALVALLLFGRRLPDVARSFGKSIVEFKKGIRDVQEDIENPRPTIPTQRPSLNNTTPSEKEPAGKA